MTEFNFRELFSQAFGYNAPENTSSLPQAPARLEQSLLGQPYYVTDIFGREFFLPVTINGYLIPFAVMSVTSRKLILADAMPESGGSINESISIDDYLFTIKGIAITDNNDYPEQQVIDLHRLFLISDSLEMRSVLSDIFLSGANGHKVLIKEISWPAIPGVQNAKPFEMQLKSDMIDSLEL
jgi:hypothetical protein